MTERLFDDHARPVAVFFLDETGLRRVAGRSERKEPWSDCQVEKFVALRVVALDPLPRFALQGVCRLRDR